MPQAPPRRGVASAVVAALLFLASPSRGDVLVAPKPTKTVEPTYPANASGDATVVLELLVDVTGQVADVKVTTSAGDAFDQAALAAAKELAFEPATRDGKAIPAKIPFTFTFVAPKPAAVATKPVAAPTLEGTLRSKSDDPLPGASIVVTQNGKTIASSTSDAAGRFSLAELPTGRVHVHVTLDGFVAFDADEELVAGSATTVVYRMAPSAADGIEIDVTGERPEREVTRRVLEGETMRKMPGTNGDPLRAVEAMPGVAKPPGLSGFLIVRGSAPDDTQIFVDGTWVPIAYHFGGVTSVIPGDVVERIEFYPGNFGPQYGRAIGGVVDIGLRSPRKDRFGGLLQFDLLDGRAMVEGPITSKTRVLVAARRSWVDAWLGPALRSGGTGVITAPVYQDAQFVFEHDLTDSTTLRFAAFGSDDRLALLLESPDMSDPTANGQFDTRESFARFQLRSDTKLPHGGRWTNMISWGPSWETFHVGAIGGKQYYAPTNVRSDLRVKVMDGVHAIVGVDLLEISASVKLTIPPMPPNGRNDDAPIFGRPLRTLEAAGDFFWPAAYAMLDVSPGAGLKLLPGVRVDYSQDTARWNVDPRFAARWTVANGTTLKGGVGLYHQQPHPYESISPFGTPGLKNPGAIHTSVGVEQELGHGFDVSIEGFHKKFIDLVVAHAAESSTTSGTRYDNAGSGRAYGLELLLKGKTGRFTGWLAYTLSHSERRDAPGERTYLFEYDQTHVLSALANLDLGRGWTFGGRFRYVSGRPYTPYVGGLVDLDSGSYTPVSGARLSARQEPFHALDLRIEKQWTFTDWKLAAYVDVRNVYNHKNPEGTVYRYDFAQSQPASGIPFLPIVGLRGEL